VGELEIFLPGQGSPCPETSLAFYSVSDHLLHQVHHFPIWDSLQQWKCLRDKTTPEKLRKMENIKRYMSEYHNNQNGTLNLAINFFPFTHYPLISVETI